MITDAATGNHTKEKKFVTIQQILTAIHKFRQLSIKQHS